MRFPPVEDILGIETKAININKVDIQMTQLLRDVRFAITHDDELKKKCKELSSMLDDLFRQFMVTHQSIRLLLKHAYKKDDYPTVADAASLVREQIEKIFVIVTVLKDPQYWIKQYRRNAWQKEYEKYLLYITEFGQMKRYEEYLKKDFPTYLEKLRRPPIRRGKKGKPITLVSAFAKRCIKYNWEYPDAPKPTWFKRPKGNLRGYLNWYFYFPSPWEAVKLVKDEPNYFMFLDRWYREYKYYSAYSHILMEKLMLQHFSQYKSVEAAEKLKYMGERKAVQFVFASNTVAATLCTLIMPHLKNDYGTRGYTKDYWEPLIDFSLLAKALWHIHAKDLLS